jgi:hypothetical protein
MRIIKLVLFATLLSSLTANAQDFLASVRVSAPTLQLADPKVIAALENTVSEFMNTQQWSDNEYLPEERIKCNIQITIKEDRSSSSFVIDLGVQATRPVYGSGYETSLLNHLDKDIPISFEEFKPLLPTKDNFTDNLSSVLSYYAYLIIGLDADSFSPFGGEDHFLIARDIVNSVPPGMAAADKGWADPRNTRTRYFIVENLLNARFKPFRQGMYDYHRKGLDLMHKDVDAGVLSMTKVLEAINEVDKAYPNAFLTQIFTNTKAGEIANIFKPVDLDTRLKVYSIMTRLDPANSAKYEPIRRG